MRPQLAAEVPGLFRYARTITRNGPSAEDLVQEALLRALQRAETFRAESSLATWLHRILHNLAVDRARQSREDATAEVEREVEEQWHDDIYTVDAAVVIERAETRGPRRPAQVLGRTQQLQAAPQDAGRQRLARMSGDREHLSRPVHPEDDVDVGGHVTREDRAELLVELIGDRLR